MAFSHTLSLLLLWTFFLIEHSAVANPLVKHVIKPKVVITTMFTPEQNVWLENRPALLEKNITVPGLSPLFPEIHCQKDHQVCLFTTGEGEINAAASVTALVLNPHFDLSETYFLITGIAGADPRTATLGSVAFSRFQIQAAQSYAIDAREIPSNWTFSFWNYGTEQPGVYPTEFYGTELFAVNFNLAKKAHSIAEKVKLNDTEEAAAFRKRYDYAPANEPPKVYFGDGATSDLYYAGEILSYQFANLTKILTNNSGTLSTTAQEDSATLEAILRGNLHGLVDYSRVVVMRTVSDLSYGPPGVSASDVINKDQGGFEPSIVNIYRAGNPIVEDILSNWRQTYRRGISPQTDFYGDVFNTLQKKSQERE